MDEFEQHSAQASEQVEECKGSRQLESAGVAALMSENWQAAKTSNSAAGHLPELVIEGSDKEPLKDKTDWTIAVDFTSDLSLDDGTVLRAQDEAEQLKQVLQLSKANPELSIAVQAARNQSNQPLTDHLKQEDVILERFLIHDGKLSNIEEVDSIDIAANQTGLLEYATNAAPSEHIGLIIQAHGAGADGLRGGTGSESLDELSEAIQKGLAGSGHERLDLLDLNACSMASAATIAGLGEVTEHLIASELRERVGKNFSAQNLEAIFSELMQNPQGSPEATAQVFVETANQGTTPELLQGDKFMHVGADVLASYDCSEYKQFATALDTLGDSLSKAAIDGKNRNVLEKLIDQTSLLPGGENFPERRDLNEFVQSIKTAAANGELSDKDGALAKAAESLIEAQNQLTDSLSLSKAGGYDKLGGLYIFLPVKEVREGKLDGPMGLNWLEAASKRPVTDRERLTGKIELVVEDIHGKLSEGAKEEFKPVVDMLNKLKEAATDTEFKSALLELNKVVVALKTSIVGKELRELLVHREDVPGCSKWNDFVHSFVPY